ncbi:hypothetical protein [Pseudonocardia sp. NPDC049635]|uniref:hypothetical protein n=1 Tax=Pseudonocardia sp. NPDC049635 TaxID=3155506 RepID=UPI0034010788
MSDRHRPDSGPDDGTDVGTDELTSGGTGTVREERDHDGGTRTRTGTDDSGVTEAAARELAAENEDEPTRSE